MASKSINARKMNGLIQEFVREEIENDLKSRAHAFPTREEVRTRIQNHVGSFEDNRTKSKVSWIASVDCDHVAKSTGKNYYYLGKKFGNISRKSIFIVKVYNIDCIRTWFGHSFRQKPQL